MRPVIAFVPSLFAAPLLIAAALYPIVLRAQATVPAKTVEFRIDRAAFSYWNPETKA